MKLQAIEAFLATVETGSIRAGARQLGLSQPAMSKVLKSLEEELGAALLTRGVKGIELTEYGRLFQHRAATILNESQKARQEIQQLLGQVEGAVSVMMSPAASLRVAPWALGDFTREFPRIRVHLYEGLQSFAVDKLRTGDLDIAVCPLFSEVSANEFVVTPLFDTQLHIVARQGHPLAGARSLSELQGAKWVNIVSGGSVSPLITDTYLDAGLPAPEMVVECYSFAGAVPLILKTDMLGLIPEEWAFLPGMQDTFAVLDIDTPLPVNRICMLYRRDQPLTPVAQRLATYLIRLAEL